MGQKTNPIGNRIGIIRGWESNWYGGKDYGDKLSEDDKIRRYVHVHNDGFCRLQTTYRHSLFHHTSWTPIRG